MRPTLAASKHSEAARLAELLQEAMTLARIARAVADHLPEHLSTFLLSQTQAVEAAAVNYDAESKRRAKDQAEEFDCMKRRREERRELKATTNKE